MTKNWVNSGNLRPDLNGALFIWWLSLSKLPNKKAGVEGGLRRPKKNNIRYESRKRYELENALHGSIGHYGFDDTCDAPLSKLL